jgi:cell division protein FtsB
MRKSPADSPVPSTPWRRRRRSHHHWLRCAVIFVSCALLLNAVFGDRGLAELFRARLDSRHASDTLARLKKENAGLREQARRLRQEPATIEMVAREDLGLIRPGEILVRVKDLLHPPTPSRFRPPSRP